MRNAAPISLFILLAGSLSQAAQPECLVLTSTHTGITPSAYFENAKTAPSAQTAALPRFVLTIGIPGGGKSSWTKEAQKRGWLVVSPDDIRTEILTDMREKQKNVTLKSGEQELADPENPNHYFNAPSIRTEAYDLARKRIETGLSEGRSIVWDTMNIDPKRIPFIHSAREKGYFVESLVFESVDPSVNSENVRLRAARGGLDLVLPGTPHADEKRLEILSNLHSLALVFLPKPESANPSYLKNAGPLPPQANPEFFPRGARAKDQEDYLGKLPKEQVEPMRELIKHDVFNRVEVVPVKNFGKLP